MDLNDLQKASLAGNTGKHGWLKYLPGHERWNINTICILALEIEGDVSVRGTTTAGLRRFERALRRRQKGVAEDGSTSREGLISGGNRGSLTLASSFPPFFSLVSSRWRQSPIELNTFPRIVQSTTTANGICLPVVVPLIPLSFLSPKSRPSDSYFGHIDSHRIIYLFLPVLFIAALYASGGAASISKIH